MINDPTQYPFIPFFTPRPVPTTSVFDAPRWSLCWNDEWNPAILGALKLLARPESWSGDESDILAAIQDAHTLLGSLSESCPTAPTWQLADNQDTCTDCDYPSRHSQIVNITDCEAIHHCFAEQTALANNVCIGLDGYDLDFQNRVGGHVKFINATYLSAQTNPTFQLEWTDCLGNSHLVTSGGVGAKSFIYSDFVAHTLCLHVIPAFPITYFALAATIVVDGPALCAAV